MIITMLLVSQSGNAPMIDKKEALEKTLREKIQESQQTQKYYKAPWVWEHKNKNKNDIVK